MRICYVSKTCIGHFTSSDAVYHVPLSLARHWKLVLLTGQTVGERDVAKHLEKEIVIPHRRLWFCAAYRALRDLHRQVPFDRVMTGLDEASLIPGLLAQLFLGIPWIAVCEDHPFQARYDEAPFRMRIERWVRTWFLRIVLRIPRRLVYFIEPEVLDFLWIPKSIRSPLHNSADLEVIHPLRLPADFQADEEIGYLGLVNEPKGGAYMLDVFRRVLGRRPGARLRLIGGIDPNFREAFDGLIVEFGIEGKVELTGQLAAEEALRRAARCAVCIHAYSPRPWLYWNQVLKICEYMALGRAVVSVDYPGARRLIEDGKNGLLTPWGEPQAMADAIIMLLENPDRRREIENAALERADELSWRRTEQTLFEIIQDSVKGSIRQPVGLT